jgi:Cu(I)/Ag(I) efflux system membrane protein CusA/SilA
VVPATLAIIFLLLYLIFRKLDEALLIIGTLPFAFSGGFWLLYLLGYNQSVATAVGFIALAGVSAEFGVVMLIYLKAALERRGEAPVEEQVSAAELAKVQPGAKVRFELKLEDGAGTITRIDAE